SLGGILMMVAALYVGFRSQHDVTERWVTFNSNLEVQKAELDTFEKISAAEVRELNETSAKAKELNDTTKVTNNKTTKVPPVQGVPIELLLYNLHDSLGLLGRMEETRVKISELKTRLAALGGSVVELERSVVEGWV